MTDQIPVALDVDRYDVPLFNDEVLQAALRMDGYAIIDPFLDANDLAELRLLSDAFLAEVDDEVTNEFLSIGRLADVDVRTRYIRTAGDVIAPRVAPLFVDGAVVFGSGFQVKPPCPESGLSAHQDSSLIDESIWPGVYGWTPLEPTDEHNGTLFVLPRSHLIRNPQRTLSVPWLFEGTQDLLWQHCTPMRVSAGSLVLFDSATIHGSPPNRSSRTRVALNTFVRPPGAPLLHYRLDEAGIVPEVEVFEIAHDFFTRDDILARPEERHMLLRTEPLVQFEVRPDELDRLCAGLAAGAIGRRFRLASNGAVEEVPLRVDATRPPVGRSMI